MEKHAVRMRLKPGCTDEYKARHDAIWPELVALLKQAGVEDYSIHLDAETNFLFAVMWRRTDHGLDALADHPVMRRWWAMMADIMETHEDDAPLTASLSTVFHME
ncbi:L-rhamnose mutarotase [Pararhizobium mangrovi]|uniref:L-rhamnose mutarotase n=1 Tax=Pararhizobium mangrovi TaxID=2590452 RepID=A0A506U7A9_9HYPH|nr:L-rhamnose mutarotase [Pararhizobium mangrovi]TPW30253.1 L-rhamnose mutarotase [Pararhizobium mangrovi]